MKKERINDILNLMRQRKTNIEMADILQCHPNTISKYVNYIRNNLVRDPSEIVNKIDDKLDEEMEAMTHRNLISYRKAVTPTRIEQKSETELRGELKLEVPTLEGFNEQAISAVVENFLDSEARRLRHSNPKPT